jgi:hypothetical protein
VRKEMRKEILPSLLGVLLFTIGFSVEAQQATKIPRIGYLARREAPTLATPDPSTDCSSFSSWNLLPVL